MSANPDRLMAAGVPAELARHLGTTTSSALTATGTTIADALVLASNNSYFGTVGSGTGCLLPSSSAKANYTIFNGGANALAVYPQSTQIINAGTAGQSFSLTNAKSAVFTSCDNYGWIATLSA